MFSVYDPFCMAIKDNLLFVVLDKSSLMQMFPRDIFYMLCFWTVKYCDKKVTTKS